MHSQDKPPIWAAERALAFQDQSVVDRYHLRPPYPPAVIEMLLDLAVDTPRVILDVGTGTGALARRLVDAVERVDAVDPSPAMIARGKTQPNGNHPRLHWLLGEIEDVLLDPPYALIVGGASLHWPRWDVAFPRFATLLSPHGTLAIPYSTVAGVSWQDDLHALLRPFVPELNQEPPRLIPELERRGLFRVSGRRDVDPVPFVQTVDDYVEAIHAHSMLSLDRMSPAEAAALDQRVRELVHPWSQNGVLQLEVRGSVVWGQPQTGSG